MSAVALALIVSHVVDRNVCFNLPNLRLFVTHSMISFREFIHKRGEIRPLTYRYLFQFFQDRIHIRALYVMLFILPMWVNILVRTLATVALFDFADLPLGEGALLFGMVYNFIPFMIYPIYNTLQKMDRSYIEAAEDLGASPWQQFYKVILPLSMPGVASGILMVFMPTISTFAISELLTMNNIKLFRYCIQTLGTPLLHLM